MNNKPDFDTYQDIKQIVYETVLQHACGEDGYIVADSFLLMSEEITERILGYLRACEGIPV